MKQYYHDIFSAQLSELMAQYESGFYTENELVSVLIDLISQSMTDKNWCHLPLWIQKKMVAAVNNLSQCEEIIAFGHIDPKVLKQQNDVMKAWLIEKGQIKGIRLELNYT